MNNMKFFNFTFLDYNLDKLTYILIDNFCPCFNNFLLTIAELARNITGYHRKNMMRLENGDPFKTKYGFYFTDDIKDN